MGDSSEPVQYRRETMYDEYDNRKERCTCANCKKIAMFLLQRLPCGPHGSPLVDVLEIKDGLANREHAQKCLAGLSWETGCFWNPKTSKWGKRFPHSIQCLLDVTTIKTGN